MATTWTIAIDWTRKGDFDGTDDDVTSRVISANWFLGMRKPYQDIADDSMLELVLDNSDKRFSPEYGSSPLVGYVVPFRPVRVQSDDGTTIRTHYFGWIESIEPQPNQYGERQVKITCAGPMQFFKAVETNIQLQENIRTDEIIDMLLDEVALPPILVNSAIVGDESNPVGTATVPRVKIAREPASGSPDDTQLAQIGRTRILFAGDNWNRIKNAKDDEQPSSFNIYHAIKDTVAAERGRFFFNREGQAVFWNRHQLLTDQTLQATFDNSMTELEYTFAGLEEFKNDIRITCHPRKVSANNNVLLYEMTYDPENPKEGIVVNPGREKEVNVKYKSEAENFVGARDVHISDYRWGGGVKIPYTDSQGETQVAFLNAYPGTLRLDAKATAAVLHIRSVGNWTHLLSFEVRGQTITDDGEIEVVEEEGMSITRYGRRTLRMNLPLIDTAQVAESIAQFERYRRAQPLGKVASMSVTSHGKRGGDTHSDQLARKIGDRIEVIEAQSGHTGDYFIIGEAHRLSDSATLLETTWYLESATEGNWAIVETARVYGDGSEDPVPYTPYIGAIVAY